MSKAIVLLSGGQDSTTCLFWALNRFENVEAVGFDYGQKHKGELKQAAHIARIANVEFKVFSIEGLLSGSSLTDHSIDVNEKHSVNKELPSSFTAGRNALFLSIVASYAYGKGIRNIITGVCETDFSGYPDCRRAFIDSQEKTSSLAMDTEFKIHTPLMFLSKAETWKLARELSKFPESSSPDFWQTQPITTGNHDLNNVKYNVVKIVRDLTLTDYNGNEKMNDWGKGIANNPASILRKKGFEEAKDKKWI